MFLFNFLLLQRTIPTSSWVKVPAGTPNSENHVGYNKEARQYSLLLSFISFHHHFLFPLLLHSSIRYTEDVHALDLPIPLSSLLEFFFYFGWLHVSQVLINPLGDDDEDFDVNDLLDRHLQVILDVVVVVIVVVS